MTPSTPPKCFVLSPSLRLKRLMIHDVMLSLSNKFKDDQTLGTVRSKTSASQEKRLLRNGAAPDAKRVEN